MLTANAQFKREEFVGRIFFIIKEILIFFQKRFIIYIESGEK